VLAFTIPAGIAAAAATLGSYALARGADGISAQEARTAAMLALFAVSLWVLGIIAGRAAWRITLIPAMAAFLVPLLAIRQARATFAVQLPPAGVLLQVAGVVLAAIAALTLWRRTRTAADDRLRPR
jgi:cation-transporting ATPase E